MVAGWALGLLLGYASAAGGMEAGQDPLYRHARAAVAEILVDGHHSGSGCFVCKDGRVITAAHVVGRPDRKVEVLASDGARLPARVQAVDLGHDLLLLQVPPHPEGYSYLALASRVPPPGTSVLICSTAAYRRALLQPGMIARGDTTFEHQQHFVQVTQIAALVQEGTSGGAWIDLQGKVIGIQSGSVTVKGTPAGIANVAPVTAVSRLLESGTNAATPTIGVFVDELWLLSPERLRRYPPGTEGVIVQSLSTGGPAERAGLAAGDVIVTCNGGAVRFRDDFIRQIRSREPGERIEVTVLRPDDAGTHEIAIELGRLEESWPAACSD